MAAGAAVRRDERSALHPLSEAHGNGGRPISSNRFRRSLVTKRALLGASIPPRAPPHDGPATGPRPIPTSIDSLLPVDTRIAMVERTFETASHLTWFTIS